MTETRTVGVTEVREHLEALAKDDPNTVRSCVYVQRNFDGTAEAHCIVGVMLHETYGVSLDILLRHNSVSINWDGDTGDRFRMEIAEAAGIEFDEAARIYAGRVQAEQDVGLDWASAVGNVASVTP